MSTSETPQRGWWGRNWKWVVPLGCLSILAVIPLSCAAFVGMVFMSLRNSWAFEEGLALARKNPAVIQALGEPITAGWIVSGSFNLTGPGGNAELAIPISGPKGSGTIYVIAHKRTGEWKFETAEVEIDGQRERIDLLKDRPGDKTAASALRLNGWSGFGHFCRDDAMLNRDL